MPFPFFQSLTAPVPAPQSREPHPRRWRKGSVFDIGDQYRRPVDRLDRWKIMDAAQRLERETKAKGRRNGIFGQTGLRVLDVLLFRFLNPATGQLDPSYAQIMAATGFCRQTVADALKALAVAGVVEMVRRMERVASRVWDALLGVWRKATVCVQRTNAYMVNFPLPYRQKLGDLATPLFRPRPETTQPRQTLVTQGESTRQTESSSEIINTPTPPENEAVKAAKAVLERIRAGRREAIAADWQARRIAPG